MGEGRRGSAGYTRAFGIVQPVAVAHRDLPAPADVELVTVPPDAEPTTFSVFMERPGANTHNSWSGKNAMGTTFVGRISLADGAGTCCIVAHQEPLEPGQLTISRPPKEPLAQFRELARGDPARSQGSERPQVYAAVYDVQDTRIVQSAGRVTQRREAGSFDVIPPSR